MKRFPVLVDGEQRTVLEASCIIEHLQLHHPGPVRLIPEDRDAALEVRMLDRFFDNYVSTPQQKPVFDAIRAEADRDPHGVREAYAMLETSYAWLDAHMADRSWAAGDFSLADCAAAPFLFYADWTHPIDARFANVRAYRVGHTVYVSWESPATGVAPTGYLLNVTGALSGSFGTTSRALSGLLGSGTYEMTVSASNACGTGPRSALETVVVP